MRSTAVYRTQLLSHAAAERFAGCLRANPRFTGVSVCLSPRARSECRYFVRYEPSSEARRQHLLTLAQTDRSERATEQFARYEIVGGPAHWLTINTESGAVYETTDSRCTCPDMAYHCRRSGLVCKHVLMVRRVLGGQTECPVPDPALASALALHG